MAAPERPARPIRRRSHRAILTTHDDLEARLVPALVSGVPGAAAAAPAVLIQPAVPDHNTVQRLDSGSSSPNGFTPQQIRDAYGIRSITFGAIAGDGTGQTIAIVDAYDDPGLVDSTAPNFSSSDLAQFDRQFGLPDPPSFTKVNQYGSTTGLPGTDPAGAGNPSGNWEMEEALDVEWAHAIAPKANLILVECNSSSPGDLFSGVVTAAGLPGVSTVSLSWGDSESSNETSWDSSFQTPTGHQGVTFVAAAGDGGSPGVYPAFSPNVVAVGGTTLSLNSEGSYQGETAWSSSGGGVSSVEPEPAYQQGVQSTGFRTIPDVAFDADPSTGVAVYDSYDNTGAGPWETIGGTSLAAPSWAALIAIADQGRTAAGGTTLDGATQTLPALYALPAADFHDITSGGNGGSNSGPGYDEATGLGTPRANLLVPDLAAYGLPDQLVMTAQPPGSVTAGSSFGLTVAIENAFGAVVTGATGTVTITLANNAGGATLHGSLTATVVNGIATFSGLTIDQAGSGYTISVAGAGLPTASSSVINVTPAAPAQLVVSTGPPASVTAGIGFGLAISVEDGFGNLVTSFDGGVTVSLASGPDGASLGGPSSLAAVDGVATFAGLTLTQAGNGYALEAASGNLAPVTTGPITVAAAAPAQLVIRSQPPGSVTAGIGFGLAVAVEDAYGNLATSSGGEVTIGLLNPSGGVLDGTLTTTADQGVAEFSGLTLDQVATEDTIAATSAGLIGASTNPITVTPAAPAQLVITMQPPASATAGAGLDLAVTIEDAFGNVETTDAGPVTIGLAGGPAGATLGGALTALARQGVASFSGLTIDQAGAGYTLAADSAGLPPVTSDSITVAPAAPALLAITAQPPATLTAGAGFGLAVTVEDVFGNAVKSFDSSVSLSLIGGDGGTLAGQLTTAASGGLASFSGLTLDKAGSGYALDVHSDGLTGVTSNAITVAPGAATQLVITAQPPSSVIAGQPLSVAVAAEDLFGNLATGFEGSVTVGLTSTSGGGPLAGTLTLPAEDGLAHFSGLTVDRAGPGDSLQVTSDGLTAATTTSFAVSPAPAARLVVTVQPPATITAGSGFGVVVAAVDPFGNIDSSFDGAVSLAVAGQAGGGSFGGPITVAAIGGVARVSGLTLTRAGAGSVLEVSSGGLAATRTSVFNVVAAAPSQLVVTIQPPGNLAPRQPFGLAVAAEDPFGNVATGFDGVVTAVLATDPNHNKLGGTLTVQSNSGLATFTNLTLKKTGRGYALRLTTNGLPGATTSAFKVSRGPVALRERTKVPVPFRLRAGHVARLP